MKNLKRIIIKTASRAGEGHIPSALSILDILWVLFNRVLDPDRDRFILSKGHAALGLYVILAEKGFFDHSALEDFGQFQSMLGGHPDRNGPPCRIDQPH